MNLKSLLCAATLLCVSGVAQAFPEYTITPNPGSEFTSVQNLASFNLVFSDATSIVISDATGPYLENESGTQLSCTAFRDFSSMIAGTTVINFNYKEITSNGEWTLTIPAGILTVDGETNEVITASYTMNDPTLEVEEYPEITLVSIDPADGADLSTWGTDDEDTLWKVKIQTSNDAAVNYIGWYLWDETADEYVREGNENRIDLNRYGSADDQWADGLFFSVGGETKLVYGHTYSLKLTFAGIGYNPDTNQYPTPQQIAASTELTTTVYYHGLTPLQEYSAATYVGVSPDPDTTSITSDSFSFDVTYSAPVKPVAFTYPIGSGAGTASAGTWEVASGYAVDANGLAEKWTFTIDSYVISDSEGTLICNIESMDGDGLFVKGNSNIDFDDIDYRISWSLNGSSATDNTIALTAVYPAPLTTLESLSSITVTNESNLEMILSSGTASIWTRSMEQVCTLGDPVLSEDLTEATWTFEPIVEDGAYILMIPEGYFSIGNDGIASAASDFAYYVETPSSGAEFDLFPASVTPEEYSTVESLSDVVLTFNDVTFYPMDGSAQKIQLCRVEDPDMEVIQELDVYDENQVGYNDYYEPTEYTLHFTDVTEPGTYLVLIPQGVFCDGDYDMSEGEEGYANPELRYVYFIEESSTAGEVVYDWMPSVITPNDGATVAEISSVNIEFAEETYLLTDGFTVFNASLYSMNGTHEELLEEAQIWDDFTNPDYSYLCPKLYVINFETAINAVGPYKVVIPAAVFGSLSSLESMYAGSLSGNVNPEITLYYIVGDSSGVESIVDGAETITVYDVNGVQILKDADVEAAKELKSGLYIINGKKVMIRR